jgi:hypothetical protein
MDVAMGAPARGAGAQDCTMDKRQRCSQIHVEPKAPAVPYDQLPQGARDAMCDALLVLIQRGRLVLAGQAHDQLKPTKNAKRNQGRR